MSIDSDRSGCNASRKTEAIMQISKLYNVLVVLSAATVGVGLSGCGSDDPGTGQEPVGGGGSTGSGGSGANPCDGKCHTQSNGWKICSGTCCWLSPSAACCS